MSTATTELSVTNRTVSLVRMECMADLSLGVSDLL